MITYAKKNNYAVWMPGFYDYWHFFPKLDHRPTFASRFYTFSMFPPGDVFYTFNFIFRKASQLKENPLFCSLTFSDSSDGNPWDNIGRSKSRVILFSGFVFHEYMLDCSSAISEINSLFRPASKYIDEINAPIEILKSRNDLVCGVLVRQTDYRSWNDGKYFYTSKQYARFLHGLNNSFENKKIGFFIATDEMQDEKIYSEIDCIVRVGYPLENLYSLSLCDFLVGPPSSYIGWASLLSESPLISITDISSIPSPADFSLNI
ncbi:MAG: hypothetical protein VW576_00975 [Opitutae bacterium]